MPYNINNSDGTPLTTINDNSIDTTSSSLTLFGRNILNYGQAINQNFVNLLQNFANPASPANPLQGQIWYDSKNLELKIYDESWKKIVPPFDGNTGVAIVKLNAIGASLSVTIVNNRIVTVTSFENIQPAFLPAFVVVNDTRYAFNPLFPNGITAGLNVAVSPSFDYKISGTAVSSDRLSTPRTITIIGDAEGSAVFDGSSNIEIDTQLSNLYIGNTNVTVSGTYTKIVVDDSGRIIGGGNIANSDIVAALGYVPFNGANINVSMQSNTVVARDSNGNFAANLMIGTATTAYALKNPIMIGINGDVIGAASFDGSNSVVITTQLAPVANLTAGTYSTVRVDAKGRVVAGSTTGDAPTGIIVVYFVRSFIPSGWAICDGKSYTTPSGDFITTPNLSNITVGGSGFYIMKIS